MTSVEVVPGRWRLSFAELEAAFIINALAWLGRHYQQDVAQLPPALRAYWQGKITSGKAEPDDDLKEAQEILSESRAELRSDRLALVEGWIREFELAETRDPWTVEISSAERDEFVAMLNDRRLLLALEIGITERDMETDLRKITDSERQRAIFDIDVLGEFIMITLGPQIHRP